MQKLVFTNGGGQTIDLTSGNFGITNWEGLSGVGLNIQTQQVPFQDGGVFLDALMEQREISVTVAIQDNNDLSARYERKRQLISALNPKLGEGVLVYTNDYLSRQIKAVPQLPIFENKNSNDAGTLKASVVFSCPSPYWEDLEDTVVSLVNGARTNVSNGGDVPCGVKVEMTTGNTVNPFIRNFRQNKKVGIKGSYLTNVQINTDVGKKSVTTQEMTFKKPVIYFNINSFAYSSEEGLIVGVGTNNGICVSGNGEDWRVVDTPLGYNQDLNGVCYSPILNKFIAVGGATNIGIIYSSTDGVNWKVETDQIAKQLNDVYYSEELDLFIAVGNGGTIIKSVDGTTWTDLTSGVSDTLNKLCYAKNLSLFVVVGNGGTILTSEDLTTWTSQTSGVTQYYALVDIAYSETENIFTVAVTRSLTNVGYYLISTDGVTWTQQALVNDSMVQVAFIQELSIFLATTNNELKISLDGLTWELVANETIDNIYYIEQLGLMVGADKMAQLYSSTDGTHWIKQIENLFYIDTENMIFQDGYYYVAGTVYGGVGGRIVRSSDGVNWESVFTNNLCLLFDIIYIDSLHKFYAVGYLLESEQSIVTYGVVVTSTDGENWEVENTGQSNTWRGITYSQSLGMIMLVGTNYGTLRSTDGGESWTYNTIPDTPAGVLYDVTFSEKLGLFIAVGNRNSYKSNDGINWSVIMTINTGSYNSVCYSENAECFIATGSSSQGCRIARSTDGTNWIEKTLADYNIGEGVIYSTYYHLFIIIGRYGECIISSDGINWIRLQTGVSINLTSAVIVNNRICIAGDGIFMQSQEINTENIIANLTTDSDMTMGLDVGSNEVLLGCASGDVSATISFRQKYIGV